MHYYIKYELQTGANKNALADKQSVTKLVREYYYPSRRKYPYTFTQ